MYQPKIQQPKLQQLIKKFVSKLKKEKHVMRDPIVNGVMVNVMTKKDKSHYLFHKIL